MVAKTTYPMSSPLKLQTLSQTSLGNKLKNCTLYWTRILSHYELCQLWGSNLLRSPHARTARNAWRDNITFFRPVSLETASASWLCWSLVVLLLTFITAVFLQSAPGLYWKRKSAFKRMDAKRFLQCSIWQGSNTIDKAPQSICQAL